MNNGQINKLFLESTDSETKNEVLSAIAKHYGISTSDVMDEVTDDEAEHLCDYLTGSIRSAVYVLMQRHNLVGK